MKQPIYRAAQREAFRLWFEFLRVARDSADKEIQTALSHSRERYEPWDDVSAVRFDRWWSAHKRLFEEPFVAILLKDRDGVCESKWEDSLVIEVPLNQSVTKLSQQVAALIRANDPRGHALKAKLGLRGAFQVTRGAEPKLAAIRDYLRVYRDVHLKSPSLKGRALLAAVQAFYRNRKREPTVAPSPLQTGGGFAGEENALRNLARYLQKARSITLNVARGDFPGKY